VNKGGAPTTTDGFEISPASAQRALSQAKTMGEGFKHENTLQTAPSSSHKLAAAAPTSANQIGTAKPPASSASHA
jgi:hypothetical protein